MRSSHSVNHLCDQNRIGLPSDLSSYHYTIVICVIETEERDNLGIMNECLLNLL